MINPREFYLKLFPPSYTVRICLLSITGRLLYLIEKPQELDFNKKINGVNYRIRKEGLYEKKPWFYKTLYWRLMNHREYWIVFNEGEPTPINPNTPRVTPQELYIISNSTAMQKGIRDYVSVDRLAGKGPFILLMIALIVVYLVSQYLGVRFI